MNKICLNCGKNAIHLNKICVECATRKIEVPPKEKDNKAPKIIRIEEIK